MKRHTEWLAAQQREDGSWPRLAGYTRDGWDTAWCGLALMSSGDPKYDEPVKKAAYRIAYADAPSEWIAERAMRLLFLSEYYLRTKDAQIVPGIQAAYTQTLDCAKTDHMAGHKVNGFGYGIAGQHYGTGHLALSVALASRTPITVDHEQVDAIIEHAGEACVNGTYAYGRAGAWRAMIRGSTAVATPEMIPKTQSIVLDVAPGLIKKIAADRSLDETQRAYAIELICGLDIQIHDQIKGAEQQVDVQINLPLHQLNWLDKDKAAMFSKSPFPLRTKVEITADNIADTILFETKGTQDFNLDEGTRKQSVSKPLKDASRAQFDGTAKISFKIGGTTVSHDRPLKFNTEFAHSNNSNLRRMKLQLRMAPRAYFQSQPLMISGMAFDCMYPAERMLEVQGPANGDKVNIHEGDEVTVDLASENFICPWVHSLEFDQASQVALFKPRTQKSIRGSISGSIPSLYDFDHSTSCEFGSDPSKSIIEYNFGKGVTLNGLDATYDGTHFIRVWYQDGETWIPLVWDNYSVNTSHHPTFPDTTADLWRLEIQHGNPMKIQTLRFYHNPNVVSNRGALPQSNHAKCRPQLQPQ